MGLDRARTWDHGRQSADECCSWSELALSALSVGKDRCVSTPVSSSPLREQLFDFGRRYYDERREATPYAERYLRRPFHSLLTIAPDFVVTSGRIKLRPSVTQLSFAFPLCPQRVISR